MQVLNALNPTIYAGFHDEMPPSATGLAEGTLFIYLNTPLETWIVRNQNWVFQENTPLTISIPYIGETGQEIPLAAPSGTPGGSINRSVVVLGSGQSATDLSEVEKALIRLQDLNIAILAELRISNMMLHDLALNQPIDDDLDTVRQAVLDIAEAQDR